MLIEQVVSGQFLSHVALVSYQAADQDMLD